MGYGLRSKKEGNFPSGDIVPSNSGACVVSEIDYSSTPMTRDYPTDSILYYDAEADTDRELTGGPSTFNSSILGPQYRRNADGTYTAVPAGGPIVDTFDDGFAGLRSCGAVTNLLPSGAENFSTNWLYTNCSFFSGTVIASAGTSQKYFSSPIFAFISGTSYTCTEKLKYSGVRYVQITFGSAAFGTSQYANFDLISGTVAFSAGGTSGIEPSGDSFLCSFTATATATASAVVATAFIPAFNSSRLPINFSGDGVAGVIPAYPIITATAYPQPYVPPGVTQPASNATTSGGNWFTNPDGSPLWQALTGQPNTLATRIKMGVGSGDLEAGIAELFIASCSATNEGRWTQQARGGVGAANVRIIQASDGTLFPFVAAVPWPRNAVIRRVTQVNTAGTQFRVGYMIEGTHTALQWGSWTNYDGSFNPSTLYRLMFGYNNAYPMWLNKLAVWKRQVSDTELLEVFS